MAVSELTWAGTNSSPMATSLTGLTVGSTQLIFAGWSTSVSSFTSTGGYTLIGQVAGSGINGGCWVKTATATTDNGPTISGVTTEQGIAYNGAALPTSSNFLGSSGTSTTPTFPAFTLSTTGGSSWLLLFAVDLSGSVSGATAPAGYTKRDSTTNGATVSFDSNGGLSSNPGSRTISGGGSAAWITFQIEIAVPVVAHPGQFFAFFR